MKEYGRITEIRENTPGIWYARFTHTDGVNEESEFLKFKQKEAPTVEQIREVAMSRVFQLNNPPALIPLIPELAPVIEGLSKDQQVTFNLIWTFLKLWIRQLIGRA